MKDSSEDDRYSDKEAARRRDEVVRRMIGTPPQPRPTPVRKPKELSVSKGRVRKGKARE
jgi:hypothetical protein